MFRPDSIDKDKSPIVVLVHGAWQGAWCWKHVMPLIMAKGIIPFSLNLPGRNKNDAKDVRLSTHVEFLCNVIKKYDRPVYLLGHSLAGIIISEAAERLPRSIQGLIYVAAFLLQPQESLFDAVKDNNSQLIKGLQINQYSLEVSEPYIIPCFLQHCSGDLANWAKSQWIPEPIIPMQTPINISKDNFGAIPKYYLICEDDQASSPNFQRKMCSKYDGNLEITSIDSDHSPYLSHPKKLANYIAEVCMATT